MKKPIFFYLLLAILFFSGCALGVKEDNLEKVNIAFPSWVGYGPLYLASEKGFFSIDPSFVA